MNRIILTMAASLLPVFILASGHPSFQRVPNPRIDSLVTAGIHQILLQQYREARATFVSLAQAEPGHPSGFLYQAAVLQAEAMDYEELLKNAECDSLLALARVRSQRLIDTAPDSPWGHYYLGSVLGYDSYARAQRGDWWGAATKGMSAASAFEAVLERDSTFVDAFAGLGTYYYWKSRKIEFLTWLPFVADKRDEGMRLLRECAKRGTYNRYAAMSSLIAILLDAGNNGEAAAVAQEALKQYPRNRIFLWGRATALERTGPADSAIAAYEGLLASIESDPRPNPYNELVCRLNLLLLKSPREADDRFREELARLFALQSVEFPAHLRSRAAEKFRTARQWQARRFGTDHSR